MSSYTRKLCLLIVLGCALLGCPPPSTNTLFDVGEMVGSVTDDSASVFVQLGGVATENHQFKLAYGTSPGVRTHETIMQTCFLPGERVDFVMRGLDGLTPNTRYYYAIAYRSSATAAWSWRPEQAVHTRRAPGSSFRFAVVSDAHGPGTYAEQNIKGRIGKNIQADRPDFIVTLGDVLPLSNQGCGDPPNCQTAYWRQADGYAAHAASQYRALAYFLSPVAASSLLVWVNGNHEGLAGYLKACPQRQGVLTARRKFIPLLDADEPDGFYGDLVWGDLHLIWLDPLAFSTRDPYMLNDPRGYALGEQQKAWLEATLASSTSKFKLIFSHTLFGGSGPSFPCDPGKSYARGNANFVDVPGTDQVFLQMLMATFHVNAFCYGHDHTYSVSELDGVKHVCVGTMLASNWAACLAPYYAPAQMTNDLGHLRVDVSADRMEMNYVKGSLDASNGTVLNTLSF